MMKRELLIDDAGSYVRAAILEDDVLCEILNEKHSDTDQAESLFYGRVQAIRPAIGAAFVDIGEELHAFLPIDETSRLRCGDMLIVQGAAKQATETKGLRITTNVNLAGKWLVLLPGGSGVHISKKVKNPQMREALQGAGAELLREHFGLIIRTASEEVSFALLQEEADSLYALWEQIEKRAAGMVRPGLLHRRERLDMRLVRDLRDLSRVVTNSESGYCALKQMKDAQHLNEETELVLFEEKDSLLFDVCNIETQIDKALKKRVWLPCGGYLIIDPCEAMTVIDVNSGKMILGRDLEETALRVNLEAADEIVRQLRLRDIGGIVIVDFIDMKEQAHRQQLLEYMKRAAARDRSQIIVEGMTRLGLVELTRKRIHSPLRRLMRSSCSYCSGNGEVLAPEETARRILRQIRRMQLSGQRGPFIVKCAPACAQVLSGMRIPKGSAQIYAHGVHARHAEKFDIEQIGETACPPKDALALRYEE